jgi:hypothetical protein
MCPAYEMCVAFQKYDFRPKYILLDWGFMYLRLLACVSGRDRGITVVKYRGSEYTHHNHPDIHLDQTNWHEGALETGTCGHGLEIIRGAILGAHLRDHSRQGTVVVCTTSHSLRHRSLSAAYLMS